MAVQQIVKGHGPLVQKLNRYPLSFYSKRFIVLWRCASNTCGSQSNIASLLFGKFATFYRGADPLKLAYYLIGLKLIVVKMTNGLFLRSDFMVYLQNVIEIYVFIKSWHTLLQHIQGQINGLDFPKLWKSLVSGETRTFTRSNFSASQLPIKWITVLLCGSFSARQDFRQHQIYHSKHQWKHVASRNLHCG